MDIKKAIKFVLKLKNKKKIRDVFLKNGSESSKKIFNILKKKKFNNLILKEFYNIKFK